MYGTVHAFYLFPLLSLSIVMAIALPLSNTRHKYIQPHAK
nr:MAG TPA_asm: TMEM240 family [Caudoviricetes sp.]